MTKKGICELCGFADSSYSIEENGTIIKVCKFCHDGFLERMGISPDADKPFSDVTMTLDLDSGSDGEFDEEYDSGGEVMKVAALDEQELIGVLNASPEDKKVLSDAIRKRRAHDARAAARQLKLDDAAGEVIKNMERTVAVLPYADLTKLSKQERIMASKQFKSDAKKAQIHAAANQSIDDERIKITSPEVGLERDARPKTNLDVAVTEMSGDVRFIDSFKYVFHRVVFAIFLGVVVLAAATVLLIINTWQQGLIVLGGGIVAVTLCFFLMWYMSRCLILDRRALLLRIRQQEILFESVKSPCYRELRTKFTVLKALAWLAGKLSVILSLITIVGGVVASVIFTFTMQFWILPIGILCASVAGIIIYWIVKLFADMLNYKLDIERNQQIQQQTMLDLLSELRDDSKE